MRVLVGRMRIPPRVFWSLTFPEANLLIEEWLEEGRDRRVEGAARAMSIGAMHGLEKVNTEELWRAMTGENPPGRKLDVDPDDIAISRERARLAREAAAKEIA